MANEKLTAKLSDGTEYEFEWIEDDYYLKKYGAKRAELKPLQKPEPPKEVLVRIYDEDGMLGCAFKVDSGAENGANSRLYRYVLAEEPVKKKRERWVLISLRDGKSWGAYNSMEEARQGINDIIGMRADKSDFLEIVHMVEVGE